MHDDDVQSCPKIVHHRVMSWPLRRTYLLQTMIGTSSCVMMVHQTNLLARTDDLGVDCTDLKEQILQNDDE